MSNETPTTISIDVPPKEICCGKFKMPATRYGKIAINAKKITPKRVILVKTLLR